MTTRPLACPRGFTLAELIIAMTLGLLVMAGVFSAYIFLGRSLTRLSYRSLMETQSRRILTTLASDIRNAQAITIGTIPSSSSLSLTVYNTDPNLGNTDLSKGSVPTFIVTYSYGNVNGVQALVRKTTGAPVSSFLDYTFPDNSVPLFVPSNEIMTSFSFNYYTTTGGIPISQFNSNVVPISVKQIQVNLTLQAGDPVQTTFSSYSIVSGQLPLSNRQLLNGN